MKKMKNQGVSMITLVITIVVLIILATVSINGSMGMIDESMESKEIANASEENDLIRKLLMNVLIESDSKVGIPLVDGALVVIGSGDVAYGTGYYLIPGGTEEELAKIKSKSGRDDVKAYQSITAPYVVDYDNSTFERIDELIFN